LPGRPMLYSTTKKFLEIFGLRNLQELPTLSQIDELLPEGITEDEGQKETLGDLTDKLSQSIEQSYSQGEEELQKISEQLGEISTSADFFEQEKLREKQRKDAERAQSIREAIMVGELVSNRDKNWLQRYDEALLEGKPLEPISEEATP
jgi:segregation and condensation protein B